MPALRARQPVPPPVGFEDHLSRRQAAMQLGLASEFKIRQLERQGRLHSVRGRMGTAFYPRAEVLALRVELDGRLATPTSPGRWSDADLLALLGQPRLDGQPRTAVDLVKETRISIARAARILAFWAGHDKAAAETSHQDRRKESGPLNLRAAPVHPAGDLPPQGGPARANSERRAQARLDRDALIRTMRHPDPRVRADAFARLKHDSPNLLPAR